MRIRLVMSPLLFVFLVLIVLPLHPLYADTLYVSDVLIITMREGQGEEYKVLKTLKTGTPVEVLVEEGAFLRVRTRDGTEGWVRKKYMTSDTPKTTVIAELEKKAARLQGKIQDIEKSRNSLKSKLKAAQKSTAGQVNELEKDMKKSKEEISRLDGELRQMTQKYNTLAEESKDVVGLIAERNRLQMENDKMSAERNHLRKENDHLKRLEMIKWFLAGGGVFFVGWISGKLSRQKKRYY